jgi:hypothetical protein
VLAFSVATLSTDEPVQPSLTIYNQNFAVVRQELPLELKAGVNSVQVTNITMHLEPDFRVPECLSNARYRDA